VFKFHDVTGDPNAQVEDDEDEDTVNVTVLVELVPLPHALVGVTSTLPDVVPNVTVIVLVVEPFVIDAPVGTVQV
jgi:hypothetical protein